MNGYTYLRDELGAHQAHLGGVADQLKDAATAVRNMSAPPPAYGLIGSFIPGMLQPMIDQATAVTNAGYMSVDESKAMMRSTLAEYDGVEDEYATTFSDQEQRL